MPGSFEIPRAALRAIAHLSGDTYRDVEGEDLIAYLADEGVPIEGVGLYNLMQRLRGDGYITYAGGAGLSVARMGIIRLSAAGRQEVEGWPTVPGMATATDVEALLATLDGLGNDPAAPEADRSKAREAAGALRDLGVGVVGGVIVAWLKSIGAA